MKKTAKIFTFLLTVILIDSCSSDDNNNATAGIFGKWYCQETTYHGNSEIVNSSPYDGFYIEFYELNKYRVVNIENHHESVTVQGTFVQDENTITVNATNMIAHNQFSYSYDITELTQHMLIMDSADEYYASESGQLLPAFTGKYTK